MYLACCNHPELRNRNASGGTCSHTWLCTVHNLIFNEAFFIYIKSLVLWGHCWNYFDKGLGKQKQVQDRPIEAEVAERLNSTISFHQQKSSADVSTLERGEKRTNALTMRGYTLLSNL